ncbi:MAG: VanZ family protein [Paludibacteraceae bacterium]|nr:VanZ family protein [Paludibacteraceae bacterium]
MMDRLIQFVICRYHEIPTSVAVGIPVVFCVGTILLLAFLGAKKGFRWSAGLLLLEYLFLLLLLSVLTRTTQAARSFNFTPFWSYRAIHEGRIDLLTQNIANVGAFIPIGLLLGCAFGNVKWWQVLLVGGVFSVLIETLQFVLKRGFTEFDDVWHNVVGCMIGWGVYVWIVYLIKKIAKNRIEKVVTFNPN